MAGCVQLGGHVRVDDDVTIGGLCGVHQFCRIGRGTMLSGGVPVTIVQSYNISQFRLRMLFVGEQDTLEFDAGA